jgi:hypothetical protein
MNGLSPVGFLPVGFFTFDGWGLTSITSGGGGDRLLLKIEEDRPPARRKKRQKKAAKPKKSVEPSKPVPTSVEVEKTEAVKPVEADILSAAIGELLPSDPSTHLAEANATDAKRRIDAARAAEKDAAEKLARSISEQRHRALQARQRELDRRAAKRDRIHNKRAQRSAERRAIEDENEAVEIAILDADENARLVVARMIGMIMEIM